MPQDSGPTPGVFSVHRQEPGSGLRIAVPGSPAPAKDQGTPATASQSAVVSSTARAQPPAGPMRLPKKPSATPSSSLQVQKPQLFKKRRASLKFHAGKQRQVHKQRLVFHSQQHLASRAGPAAAAGAAGAGCTAAAPLPAAKPPCQQVASSGEQMPLQLAASCLAAQLLLQRTEDEASPAAAELLRQQLAQSIKHQAAAAAAAEQPFFDVALAVQQLLPALHKAVVRVCAAAEAHQAAVTAAAAAALLAELTGTTAQHTPAAPAAAASTGSFEGQRSSASASPRLQLQQLQQLLEMPATASKDATPLPRSAEAQAAVDTFVGRLVSYLATA